MKWKSMDAREIARICIGLIVIGFLQIGAWAAAAKPKSSASARDRQHRKLIDPNRRLIAQDQPHVGDQMRLLQDILDQYDNRIRPVRRPLQPINITVRMNLYQIVEIEERTQHVNLYAWMTQMWYDELLAWDPASYGNVTMVVLPYNQIWIPDTYLYNNLQMEREASERWSHVIVEMRPNQTKAHVTFRYPAMYKFICNMHLHFFPFDRQRCRMQFGSWIFDATGVDYFPEKRNVAREDFVQTGHEEWQLLSFTGERRLQYYACCPYPFSLLEFRLVVERRPLHYVVNLVIPTFIVSVVSNVGFFTPTTTGGERIEKVNLGLTTLLAYSVLLMMVSDSMPTTSSTVPLVGWFLLGTIVQTSVATITTTIILLIHKKGNDGRPVPQLARRFFFGWLNHYLGVKSPDRKIVGEYDTLSEGGGAPILTRFALRRPSNVYSRIYFGHNGVPSVSRRQSRANVHHHGTDETSLDTLRLLPLLQVTRPSIPNNNTTATVPQRKTSTNSIANGHPSYGGVTREPTLNNIDEEELELDEGDQKSEAEIEWEWLASILDRFFLILSLVSLCMFVIGITAIGYLARQYY